MATIQGIYIALFGRPADPLGLAFWEGQTSGGDDLTNLIFGNPATGLGPLVGEPEYTDRFLGKSNFEIVVSIYKELFGDDRVVTVEEADFYVRKLNNGELTIADVAINIYDGASGSDLATLQNKEAAADLFTAEIDTTDEILAYNAETIGIAQAYLDPITDDPATVPDEAAAAAAVQAMVDFDAGGGPGETFTFTTGPGEIFDGTANADTFNVILGAGQTLNSFEEAHGAGSIGDVMNIESDGTVTTIPPSAVVDGVETINWAFSANPATAIDASDFGGSTRIAMSTHAAAVDNVNGQVIAFAGATVEAGDLVTVDTGVGSLSVELDNVVSGSFVNGYEETAGDLTTLSVSGSVAAAGALFLNSNATALETVSLELSSDGTVDVAGIINIPTFTTFDASASTGNLTVDFDVATNGDFLETISFGSGADNVSYDQFEINNETGGATLAINVGGGNDTLNIDMEAPSGTFNGRIEAVLGEGSDLVDADFFGAIALLGSAAQVEAGLLVLSDFNVSEDTLDVTSGGPREVLALNELADIRDEADLLAALQKADDFIVAGSLSVFEFGGNSYVFNDGNGSAAFDAGDDVIELTGVTVAQLNASNFLV